MTPAEVAYRAVRAIQARAERSGIARERNVPAPDLAALPNPWIKANAQVDAKTYVDAAERIAHGWIDVFALRNVNLGQPPRWNRDPKTGIEAPLAFGKLLDYRNPDVVGDIKYLWEPNRHLHLVTLAQGYALSGKKAYFDTIAEHLDSWFLACPYGYGPNWSSALEAGLRLINWSATWQLLGPEILEKESAFRGRWLDSIYQHAQFIRGWFSLHSSANNHLIGEAAGLFIAALTWPCWPAAKGWRETAKAILEREALVQNAPDGVNREQAVAYQQFVLDFQLLCLLAGKANGQWFSADYESRLESMLDYLASIMDAGGNVPMFGDADDGFAVRLAPQEGFCPYKSLLATGALLFRRGDFRQKARTLDDKTRWLFGATADAEFEALDASATRLPIRQTFPEGGYFVLGCGFDTPGEIRVVADAGPLGYRSIAAHGHADALSFSLSAGGLEFLIDPGTYAYHTQERWRNYFRGTSAHNTVRLDALDQSVPGGNFMWLSKARAGCSLWLSSAGEGQLRGLARRLHAPRRPGEAPAPDRARQARAPRAGRGHARDGGGARRRALLPLPRGLLGGRHRGRLFGRPRGHFAAAAAAASRECGRPRCTAAASRRFSAGSRAPSTRAARRRPSPGARGSPTARCCAREILISS